MLFVFLIFKLYRLMPGDLIIMSNLSKLVISSFSEIYGIALLSI